MNTPILSTIIRRLNKLEADVKKYIVVSVRAETAGSAPRVFYADLPASPVEGMWFYVRNGRKSGEGVGAGTGMIGVYTDGEWRCIDDLTQIVQI